MHYKVSSILIACNYFAHFASHLSMCVVVYLFIYLFFSGRFHTSFLTLVRKDTGHHIEYVLCTECAECASISIIIGTCEIVCREHVSVSLVLSTI